MGSKINVNGQKIIDGIANKKTFLILCIFIVSAGKSGLQLVKQHKMIYIFSDFWPLKFTNHETDHNSYIFKG